LPQLSKYIGSPRLYHTATLYREQSLIA